MKKLSLTLLSAIVFSSVNVQPVYGYFRPPVTSNEVPDLRLRIIDLPVVIPISSDSTITRSQLVKMAIDHVYAPEQMQECFDLLSPSNYWLLFADVPTGADYGVQLCKAMRLGAVDGYSNATFRPDSPVNLAESSKILAQVFGLSVVESGDTEWYQPYTDALSVSGVNIRKLGHLDEPLTYNQAAELLSQLSKG